MGGAQYIPAPLKNCAYPYKIGIRSHRSVAVFVIIISSFFIIIRRTATAIITAVLAATYQRPARVTGNTWVAVSLTQAAWRTAI